MKLIQLICDIIFLIGFYSINAIPYKHYYVSFWSITTPISKSYDVCENQAPYINDCFSTNDNTERKKHSGQTKFTVWSSPHRRTNFFIVTTFFIFNMDHTPQDRGQGVLSYPRFSSMADHLISVHVISSNRCIVPWSVVTVEPTSSFDNLFSSLKAGKYSVVSWNVYPLGKRSRLCLL